MLKLAEKSKFIQHIIFFLCIKVFHKEISHFFSTFVPHESFYRLVGRVECMGWWLEKLTDNRSTSWRSSLETISPDTVLALK